MYWFEGRAEDWSEEEPKYFIRDDKDGVVESFTIEQINYAVRNLKFVKLSPSVPVLSEREIDGLHFTIIDKFDKRCIVFNSETGFIHYIACSTAYGLTGRIERVLLKCISSIGCVYTGNNGIKARLLSLYVDSSKCGRYICKVSYLNLVEGFETSGTVTYDCLTEGEFTSPYYPSNYGVGFLGKYHLKSFDNVPFTGTKAVSVWRDMLKRCYDTSSKNYEQYGGSGVTVDEFFLNASNFYDWYMAQSNVVAAEESGVRLEVEKDLAGKKCYSPDTCFLVPQSINNLFKRRRYSVSQNYPKHISYSQKRKRFRFTYGKYVKYISCQTTKHSFLSSDREYIDIARTYYDTYKIDCPSDDMLLCIGKLYTVGKELREKNVRELADSEYAKGFITKEYYDLMYQYEYLITEE